MFNFVKNPENGGTPAIEKSTSKSKYFLNFGEISSALVSGFSLQSIFAWKQLKPLIIIDYSSFILKNSNATTFSSWKYGVGIKYTLPNFEKETSISLTILGELQYKALYNSNSYSLSSNTVRVGIDRVATTKFLNFNYGIAFEREQLTFMSATHLDFSPVKENVYTVRAHIGLDLDFKL